MKSCHHIFTISHFLLLSYESQRLSEIKDPHVFKNFLFMSKHELLDWSPSSLPHNINCPQMPSSFSAELLLLSSTSVT